MPEIDYLIVSHDHWDHLDHATVTALMPKVKNVVCPLGVAAHFEHWGYPTEKLHEADWKSALRFQNGFCPCYPGPALRRSRTYQEQDPVGRFCAGDPAASDF